MQYPPDKVGISARLDSLSTFLILDCLRALRFRSKTFTHIRDLHLAQRSRPTRNFDALLELPNFQRICLKRKNCNFNWHDIRERTVLSIVTLVVLHVVRLFHIVQP